MRENQRTTEGFDRFVDELRREVGEQVQAAYSAELPKAAPKGFSLRKPRRFAPGSFTEEAYHPSHIGRMNAPDAYGRSMGWCGDMMEVYLRLDGNCIEAAKFMTDGCGPTIACGNALARLVEGLTLEEASDVMPERIVEALDGLSEGHLHCAELAVSTLQNAIFGWRFKQQERKT